MVFDINRGEQSRHLDCSDEFPSLNMWKSHDTDSRVRKASRDLARCPSPIEHLANDLDESVGCVRVFASFVAVYLSNIRGGDYCHGVTAVYREK